MGGGARPTSMPKRLLIAVAYVVACLGLAFAIAGPPGPEPLTSAHFTTETSTSTSLPPPPPTTSTTVVRRRGRTSETLPVAKSLAIRPAKDVNVRLYNGSTLPEAATVVGATLAKAGYELLSPGPRPVSPAKETRIWFVEGWGIEAAGVAAALKVPPERVAEWSDSAPAVGDGEAAVLVVVADDVARPG
jgi:hypothetical protein